jgi:DNA processing protein
MSNIELQRWLQLSLAYQFSAPRLKVLWQHAGTIAALQQLSTEQYFALELPEERYAAFARWQCGAIDSEVSRLVDTVLDWAAQPSHSVIPIGSDSYPPLLATCIDAPPQLFVRGDPALLRLPQIALVGSRNPTADGRRHARKFAGDLVQCGYQVTSGLARGIDAESHRGALEGGGKTIAVLGTGLANIYPASNHALAEQIVSQGALVSELPPAAGPDAWHFPERNRIISGLSHGVLVIEAAEHSGSLITARLAGELGREVFALPGSINNPMTRGCHKLIRQGARLIESADEIIDELPSLVAWEKQRTNAQMSSVCPVVTAKCKKKPALADGAASILQHIGYDPITVDMLAVRSDVLMTELLPQLLQLELQGYVELREQGYVLSSEG